MTGYFTFDPPVEHVALFRYGPGQAPEKWTGERWVSHPQALGYVLESTEIVEQTPARVRELFPDADLRD